MNVMREQNLPHRVHNSDDPIDVLRFARDACVRHGVVALATLTEIRGGASRAIGAQMAVSRNGAYCGYLSGGCLEGAVATEAIDAIRNGENRRVRYGQGSPYFDIVLPCGGGVTISIHVVSDVEPLELVLDHLGNRRPVALTFSAETPTLTPTLLIETNGVGTSVTASSYSVSYRPRCRLVLQGGPAEIAATEQLASVAGYDLLVWNAGCDEADIDQDTAVAILHHDIDKEMALLCSALVRPAFYVGALGSKRTHKRRKELLLNNGFSDKDIQRIKAPIGLFAKARDSMTLAISVLADVAVAKTRLI